MKDKKTTFISIVLVLGFFSGQIAAEYFFNFSDSSLIPAVGGVIGIASVGLGLLFMNKSFLFQASMSLIGIGLGVSIIYALSLYLNIRYDTCEICGYKAVKENATVCELCENEVWEIQGLPAIQKDSWLIDEQWYWFSDEDEEGFDFYKPKELEGFKKDMHWEPMISTDELFDQE